MLKTVKVEGNLKTIKQKLNTKTTAAYVAVVTGAVGSGAAMAITAPVTGSFAYDLYDVAVNSILNGAPGFVGGLVGVVYSASKLGANWMLASLGILGSTAVLQADTITTSLGAVI